MPDGSSSLAPVIRPGPRIFQNRINLFDDFFFRLGKFYDNVRGTKGTGWGLGWTGPKLGVEFAQKISDQFVSKSYLYQDESLVDTSLSAIIKF